MAREAAFPRDDAITWKRGSTTYAVQTNVYKGEKGLTLLRRRDFWSHDGFEMVPLSREVIEAVDELKDFVLDDEDEAEDEAPVQATKPAPRRGRKA